MSSSNCGARAQRCRAGHWRQGRFQRVQKLKVFLDGFMYFGLIVLMDTPSLPLLGLFNATATARLALNYILFHHGPVPLHLTYLSHS